MHRIIKDGNFRNINTITINGQNFEDLIEQIEFSGFQTQQGSKLVGTGNSGGNQGFSTSLSADGNTVAIGSPGDDAAGATWIFTRTNGIWTQQGNKLVAPDAIGNANQGWSVSLSGDGNTLAVGGPFDDNPDIGATWIWIRKNGIWTKQQKLIGTGVIGISQQGFSVSLSGDGNTLASGGYRDNNFIGATWIWTRKNGIWTQIAKLVASPSLFNGEQGYSVSLSKDGLTLAVGSVGVGVWIFIFNNGIWYQQTINPLYGTDGIEPSNQGTGVSLSANGSTLAICGIADNSSQGAVWIFNRIMINNNIQWIQKANKLIGSSAIGVSQQGSSVSLNGEGDILVFGGSADNVQIGAFWIFELVNNNWIQKSKVFGSGYIGKPRQGISISLSQDGTTLSVGGSIDNLIGATWIFIN